MRVCVVQWLYGHRSHVLDIHFVIYSFMAKLCVCFFFFCKLNYESDEAQERSSFDSVCIYVEKIEFIRNRSFFVTLQKNLRTKKCTKKKSNYPNV